MATPRNDERSVSRTYRAAIRLGEDFITLEETITLPIDASDDEVQQAVELGWRIYNAQRAAVEGQIHGVREAQGAPAPITVRDPEAPASDKQRNYISVLQEDLTWNSEQLASYADDQGVDLVNMTKGQASVFIDTLKKLSEERGRYQTNREPAQGRSAEASHAAAGPAATERQMQALLKLAQVRGVDLEAETQQRFGVAPAALNSDQASAILSDWQRTTRNGSSRRTTAEPVL
ncbi:MAG: hypothetical protein MUD01_18210 [Chloroflexaceae bacterium]|jgi:hypothetical protein|nr:hypothetical protein [Chloroflexaceae bacterium]